MRHSSSAIAALAAVTLLVLRKGAAMRKMHVGLIALAIMVMAIALAGDATLSGPATAGGPDRDGSVVRPEVTEALAKDTEVRVIISLRQTEGLGSPPDIPTLMRDVASKQARVLSALSRSDFTLVHRYEGVAGLAGDIRASAIPKLERQPDVISVGLDIEVHATLAESVPLIGADIQHGGGNTGAGIEVAVLDTGIDTDHPELSDDLLSEECFLTSAFAVVKCPVGGAPTTCSGAGCAEDDDLGLGHGSHVSGIITSNGTAVGGSVGVAPDTKVHAYKVLDSGGTGGFSDMIAALSHIIVYRPSVVAINMSIGSTGPFMPGMCEAFFPAFTTAVNSLRARGTTTVIASGNDGDKIGMDYPGCVSTALSVGMTYDATNPLGGGGVIWTPCTDSPAPVDTVACASNSDLSLDLLAPGAFTTSSVIGGGVGVLGGTSMATPHITGSIALLLTAIPGLSPDDVEFCLESTGVPITDTNGITTPRVDIDAAVTSGCPGFVFHGQDALFSVGTPDIGPGPPSCEGADLLVVPGLAIPCARGVSPPAPVPDLAIPSGFFGLDLGGPATDEMDAISMGEPFVSTSPFIGSSAPEFHFSVDSLSTGVACAPPDVFSEVAAVGEAAHGDIYTDLRPPASGPGCNALIQDDDTAIGLAPANGLNDTGVPLDDMDALTDPPSVGPMPCGGLPCSPFSVDAGSAIVSTLDANFVPIFEADLLVPPGTPPYATLPAGCAGPGPCVAIPAPSLGLDLIGGAGTDDLDALCWFDNGAAPNGLPDLPGFSTDELDRYFFSLAPGSASLAGVDGIPGTGDDVSPADILATVGGGPFFPVVIAPAPSLGLLTGDNLDALKCLNGGGGAQVAPPAPVVATCTTYVAAGLPLPIADFPGATLTSTIVVPGPSVILTDVNVGPLNISHTFTGDLDVDIDSPAATTVLLFDDVGEWGGTDFLETVLDDQSGIPISDASTIYDDPYTGIFQPEGSLASFNGESSAGTWTLSITDDTPFDVGTLDSWSLELCGAAVPPDVDGDGIPDASDTEGPSPNISGLASADDCGDGVDNNANGFTDALDPGCAGLQQAIFSVHSPDVTTPLCEGAALLTLPLLTGTPCVRAFPAPDSVVPPVVLGLDLSGPFSDELDAVSLADSLGLGPAAYHFSVDLASGGLSCAPPDVFSEAALTDAHGDIFTDLSLSGCNSRFQDEALQGLVAPPTFPPVDDMDALTDPHPVGSPTPCAGGTLPCAVFSIAAGSALDGTLDPNGVTIGPADLLVPPTTPPYAALPAGCAGPGPCVAVLSTDLSLDFFGPDDLDALCWFDYNGNGLPDKPLAIGGRDDYRGSLAPGSGTLLFLGATPSDILSPGGVVVLGTALGLAPSDNLDALKCLQVVEPDADSDGIPDSGDTEGPPGNINGFGGVDDCTDSVDNDGDSFIDAADPGCVPPPPPGVPVFSVRDIFTGAHDITPTLNGFGLSCAGADLLSAPGSISLIPCAIRVALPPGPLPDSLTFAPTDLGLDGPPPPGHTPFFDDLNAVSFGEIVNTGLVDYDFSVDAAPPNLGFTVGIPCGPPPLVFSEAGLLEAQGDIFNTGTLAPAGCNFQKTDELALGLIAPNLLFPPAPPLDDMDALSEVPTPLPVGPCTLGGPLLIPITCWAFSLTPFSAVMGAIPLDGFTGFAADEGSILVPPGTPPIPLSLPLGCAGPTPCIAVSSAVLGLAPGFGGDDIDALCWFDGNLNGLPDLPNYVVPGAGDYYIFSLSPGSASVSGPPFYSAADLLVPTIAGPVVLNPSAALGLVPTDDVDGLICRDNDTDLDGAPDLLDNCPLLANASQTNTDLDVLAAGGWTQNGFGMTGDSLGDVCDPDDDNDFVDDADEQRVYVSPGFAAEQLVPCLSPGNPDPWPLDVSPAGAPDTGVGTGDVLYELGFVGLFTASPGFDPRLDFAPPAGGISLNEVLYMLGFVGFFCGPP